MKIQRNKGFTLVELLMVLAVVGLLASILIPTAGNIRESAIKTVCKAQLSQYINAIVQFKSQYGYYPMSSGNKDFTINLSDPVISKEFIEIMSGRRLKQVSRKVQEVIVKELHFTTFLKVNFIY